jgi:hypothetical protein
VEDDQGEKVPGARKKDGGSTAAVGLAPQPESDGHRKRQVKTRGANE